MDHRDFELAASTEATAQPQWRIDHANLPAPIRDASDRIRGWLVTETGRYTASTIDLQIVLDRELMRAVQESAVSPTPGAATELRYEDCYRDGDAGYIWPCGCAQYLGGDISRCKEHLRAASAAQPVPTPGAAAIIEQAEWQANQELAQCEKWHKRFLSAMTETGRETAARSEAERRAFAQIHRSYAERLRAASAAPAQPKAEVEECTCGWPLGSARDPHCKVHGAAPAHGRQEKP